MERILILDANNVVRYLIYKSMIDKYLGQIALGTAAVPAGRATADLTLKNLVDFDPTWKHLFENSFGFVAETATLSDAKAIMDKIDKCGDVFVTKTGNKAEAILGSITDNTITENSKV